VGFAVKRGKAAEFIGRDALAQNGEPRTRLRCLTLEDSLSVALGNEPVRVEGGLAGRVTSGGYGYTVGRSIAYAHLPPDRCGPGTEVEVEIFGRWVGGQVASEPLFDPEGERVRA
jgi:4-methylaminobutanoate oxidase (formaldehyde-forming)